MNQLRPFLVGALVMMANWGYSEEFTKVIQSKDTVLWTNGISNNICYSTIPVGEITTSSVSFGEVIVETVSLDCTSESLLVATKLGITSRDWDSIYSVYHPSETSPITPYENSSQDAVRIVPIAKYQQRLLSISQDSRLEDYTSSAINLSSKNWDFSAIDENHFFVCQFNIDQSIATIWMYYPFAFSGSKLSTEGLRRFSPGSDWYCFATCSLKVKGVKTSMFFISDKLYLLNDKYLAEVSRDTATTTESVWTSAFKTDKEDLSIQNFVGTPKDLSWLPISDSKTSDLILWNKAAGEFSLMNETRELVTVNLSHPTPKIRKESGESSRSLLLKEVATKERLLNEARKNDGTAVEAGESSGHGAKNTD